MGPAIDEFVGGLESEVVRRAMEVPKRGVYYQGRFVDLEERPADSDRLLLRVLERHAPEWRPGRVIDAQTNVDVDVRAAMSSIQALTNKLEAASRSSKRTTR